MLASNTGIVNSDTINARPASGALHSLFNNNAGFVSELGSFLASGMLISGLFPAAHYSYENECRIAGYT